mmetsp:Transcript_86197/g.224864  ORF Transcript_86197/g.224864 Transcript_86197/m.224864 type:complete len:203 (+) Transcript_86197:120-728(+)
MAKRKIVPSSSEDDSAGRGKEAKASKERKDEKDAEKGKSPKEKVGKKDKKDKKDKDKKAKKDEAKADKQKEQAQPEKKDKKADKKEKKAAKGKAPTKEVVFNVKEVCKSASRPFGMELDGALVVDIMDKAAACPAGVQIGWYVESVNWQAVPQEDEKFATRVLRDAEEAAAKDGKPVRVVFCTQEPAHWTAALKKLRGPGAR